jgi:hypothetical protein
MWFLDLNKDSKLHVSGNVVRTKIFRFTTDDILGEQMNYTGRSSVILTAHLIGPNREVTRTL